MNLIKAIVLSEKGGELTTPQEVVAALSHALVGKKITAFGPKGKGLWGEHPEVQSYRIKKLIGHFGKMEDGEPAWGNIDIYLDGYDSHGSKIKDKHGHTAIVGGLIYTDKTFIAHLKQLLAGVPAMEYVKSLGYSEQGMQGRTFVNLDIDFKKFPKTVTEGKEEPHVHQHKVGDDIEWEEEEGDAENGPTGRLNTAYGTVTKLHPKGYMVKRHDSFSGDDKEQLIHHNWARKVEHPPGYYEESLSECVFHMRSKLTKAEIEYCKKNGIKITRDSGTSHAELMAPREALEKFKDEFFAMGTIEEGVKGDYDIHVKKVPSGTFGQVKITREIVHTKHPELKKHYGTKGDGLTTDMVNRMKAKGYKVKEDGGAYEGEYHLLEGAADKQYSIESRRISLGARPDRVSVKTGTIPELIKYFSYTLEVGSSYEHEKGNKKVNRNPKTAAALVSALNAAAKNSGSHYQGTYYSLVPNPTAPADKVTEAKKPAKKDPSSVILDIAVQGGGHPMGTDADTIKWAKKYNCTAKKLKANGPGGGWPEWKFTGDPKDIRRLVTNYCGDQKGEIEYLLGHEEE